MNVNDQKLSQSVPTTRTVRIRPFIASVTLNPANPGEDHSLRPVQRTTFEISALAAPRFSRRLDCQSHGKTHVHSTRPSLQYRASFQLQIECGHALDRGQKGTLYHPDKLQLVQAPKAALGWLSRSISTGLCRPHVPSPSTSMVWTIDPSRSFGSHA